ncbi:armadillo-type protein [Pavlovales sp. CCMP2436]|nr:armadillo-type protein [Pavlovales sp. CCMP2436]
MTADTAGKANGLTPVDIVATYKRIFSLRNETVDASVDELERLFGATDSVLLRHEIAYALGQMQLPHAEPFLKRVLADQSEHPITRHEAAEALGAIGSPANLDVLREYASDPAPEVSQTCALAVHRIEQNIERGMCACEKTVQAALVRDAAAEAAKHGSLLAEEPVIDARSAYSQSAYMTVDPAASSMRDVPFVEVAAAFSDERQPLHVRYSAMFALRDLNTKRAANALAAGLRETSSALFRHEVAFVLGQLEQECTTEQLKISLADRAEHPMVRHEAAEALGAIGSDDAISTLREYSEDSEAIVRDSCLVALDMYDRGGFEDEGVMV